jgi:(2Fe-2S) ferredoxin
MKTIEDLNQLRERARADLSLRSGQASARITVCMGTCGIASGAREVLLAVLEELGRRGITDVAVTQSGCRGLCEREPMMEVEKPGLPVVAYGDLDPDKARAVIAQHLEKGVIIEEWVVTKASRPEPTA